MKEEHYHLSIFLSQQPTTNELVERAGLSKDSSLINQTPYCSGYPADKLSDKNNLPQHVRLKIEEDL